jgi:hypothetical protein
MGDRMRAWKVVAGFTFWMTASGAAVAAPCAGFTDVDDADVGASFCQNVEWLKNRQVTLGCPGVNVYCPNDPVSRLQMAAFMNRLGNALEPVFVDNSNTAVTEINANGVSCQTSPYVVQNYPRVATAIAMLYHEAATAQLVTARIVYSADGGMTWQSFSDFYTLATNVAGGWVTQSPVAQSLLLAVGQSVIFGIRSGEFGSTPTVVDAG